MRPILLKLAHRLITSSPTPSFIHPERFHLHLSILLDLEVWDEANKLIDSEVGMNICATSLSCNEVRRAIWSKQGRRQQEGERAEKAIVEKRQALVVFLPVSILIGKTEIVIGWSFWQFLMPYFLLHRLHPLTQMFSLRFTTQKNCSPRWLRKMVLKTGLGSWRFWNSSVV